MKTLSGTLDGAQRAVSQAPVVRVRVANMQGSQRRLRWARWYSGAEADLEHAACVTGNGTLLRFRVNGTTLEYQRMLSPAVGSAWSSGWVGLATVTAGTNVAAAAFGSTVLFASITGGNVLSYVSTADGAVGTWTGPTTIAAGGWDGGNWIGLALRDATAGLFVSVVDDGSVLVNRWNGAAWTGWGPVGPVLTGSRGVAVAHWQGDWWLLLTSVAAGGAAKLEQVGYGDGAAIALNTWGTRTVLEETSDGSQVSFERPALLAADVLRASWSERYIGTGAYSRVYTALQVSGSAAGSALWTEPQPFPSQLTRGIALAAGGASVFAAAPSGVWRAALDSTNGVDVSARVVSLGYERGRRRGTCRVELDTSDGLLTPGTGSFEPIALGSEVRIEPGLRTSAGAEYGQGHCFTITGLGWDATPGRARLVLEGSDGWELLRTWTPARPLSFSGRSVSQIVDRLLARVGYSKAALTATTAWTGLLPAFAVLPGESGLGALERLLGLVEDELLLRERDVLSLWPWENNPGVYVLGGSGHALRSYRRESRAPAAVAVEVVGTGVRGLFVDEVAAGLVPGRRRFVRDQRLTTGTQAGERARAEWRAGSIGAEADVAECLPVLGVEVWDVVTVTEARAGLSGAKRRVLGHGLRYGDGEWSMRLELGNA